MTEESKNKNMPKQSKIKPGSFADGIRMLNEKGALVIPVNLTKRRAIILLDLIHKGLEDWNCTHEEGHFNEHDVQAAVQWVRNQVFKRWSQTELYNESNFKK